MTLNHIHLQVSDLKGAIDWFERILQIDPGFQNERMATFAFDAFTVIVDAASDDAPATMRFESDDCDRDFRAVVERGAIVLEHQPTWNGESELPILRGPGALRLEIEGPVAGR